MQGISAELVNAAAFIKNMTDTGLFDLEQRVGTIQSSQQDQSQEMVSDIGQKIANVSSSITAMHEQMNSEMEQVRRIAETVQAEMQDADKRILEELAKQEAQASKLKTAQEEMLSQISYNESWQEKKEATDFGQELPARLHDASALIMLNLSQGLVQLASMMGQELSP